MYKEKEWHVCQQQIDKCMDINFKDDLSIMPVDEFPKGTRTPKKQTQQSQWSKNPSTIMLVCLHLTHSVISGLNLKVLNVYVEQQLQCYTNRETAEQLTTTETKEMTHTEKFQANIA